MADNNDKQNNGNNNGSGSSNFIVGQIIDISRELSSITKESKIQFENLTKILQKIEKVVDANAQVTQQHSEQIKKLYSVLNAAIAAIKNLKVAVSLKTKSLESQMKTFVPKTKWKTVYTIILAILTIIGAILINLDRIKTLLGVGISTP